MMHRRIGNIKKKIILLLSSGVALGATKSIGKQIEIISKVSKEWGDINKQSLKISLTSLYNSKLIDLKPKGESFEIILLTDGKKLAAQLDLENMKIPIPKNWDGLWRIAMFDIPEKLKKVRRAMRFHLTAIGFSEYQKSVFITPYPCEKELKFVVEFFQAKRYTRFIVAKAIDNENEFKRKFDL